MPNDDVVEWLLEEDQPAVRYLALTELLERSPSDPEVVRVQRDLTKRGWVAEILSRREPGGWWVNSESLYRPKYLATNWMLLVLADLRLTKSLPEIRESCELWIGRFSKSDGGFGADGSSKSHHCIAGNTARALIRFGYEDHPSVRSALEWLVRTADKKGGWSCFGSGRNLDSWEGLSAFAAYPRSKWTGAMEECVRKAAEFYLERELQRQGSHYEPWYRFHYPVHYYYDLLVGLDLLTRLGYSADSRLAPALEVLRKRRREDGRWNLDEVHPDLEGPIAEWISKHPKQAPTPFALETVGKPSKLITLRALAVLNRVGQDGQIHRMAARTQ